MEEICQRYDDMWSSAMAGFETGFFEFDPLIDDASDTRRGMTLVGRLRGGVVSRLYDFLDDIRKVEPAQYVYPANDLHITALAVITAHSTVLRFRTPVTRGAELVEILKAYRDHDFGDMEIPELELVFNDWYQRAANTRRLHRFGLCG